MEAKAKAKAKANQINRLKGDKELFMYDPNNMAFIIAIVFQAPPMHNERKVGES